MRRTTYRWCWWVGVVVAVLSLGCGPPWTIVRETVPSPMARQNGFAVMPIDFSGLRVGDGTEADYLADKDGEQRDSWVADKVAMNEEFARHLIERAQEHGLSVTAGGSGARFVIHPKVSWLEPGFYAVVASRQSEVEMTVSITHPDGTLIDEIVLRHSTAADMINLSSGQRLRDDAEELGKITADYLRYKVLGED